MWLPTQVREHAQEVARRAPMSNCPSGNIWQCQPGIPFTVVCSVLIGCACLYWVYLQFRPRKVSKITLVWHDMMEALPGQLTPCHRSRYNGESPCLSCFRLRVSCLSVPRSLVRCLMSQSSDRVSRKEEASKEAPGTDKTFGNGTPR